MSRRPRSAVLLGLAAVALAPLAIAAPPPNTAVAVRAAWMRPSVAGGSGAAYLTIVNRGAAPDTLVSAGSPDAAQVSLHESRMVGQVMTMRSVSNLPIRSGGEIRFAPNGLHLMLQGLKRSFRTGDRLALVLTFAKAGQVRTWLAVRPDASADSMAGMKM